MGPGGRGKLGRLFLLPGARLFRTLHRGLAAGAWDRLADTGDRRFDHHMTGGRQLRPWRMETGMTNKPCTKCGKPTERFSSDAVSGAVGIPLCARCSGKDMSRLVILLLALGCVLIWAL